MPENEEKNPTYEELLEEYRHREKRERDSDSLESFVGFALIFSGYACIAALASMSVPQVISMYYLGDFLSPLVIVSVKLTEFCIGAYIVWHEIFAQMYIHDEQIVQWCKDHNFLKNRKDD